MCARFSYWWLNHPTGIPDSATDVTNDQLPLPWFPVLDSLMTDPPNWVSLFKTQLLMNDPPNRDFPMFWDVFLYLFCCYLLLCCYVVIQVIITDRNGRLCFQKRLSTGAVGLGMRLPLDADPPAPPPKRRTPWRQILLETDSSRGQTPLGTDPREAHPTEGTHAGSRPPG